MKRVFKKFLIIVLIIFTLNNFLISSLDGLAYKVYADDPPTAADVDATRQETTNIIEELLGAVIGIFTFIPKVSAVGLAVAVDNLLKELAYSQGYVDDNGNIQTGAKPGVAAGVGQTLTAITPFDILFNKIAITDINFFNFDGLPETHVIYKIRTNIAGWYYVMRIITLAILLVILVYIGIRMALSTVAIDKVLYKKMLVDWLTSLALVFLLHYIAIFAINANSALVNMLANVGGGTENNTKLFAFEVAMADMLSGSFGISLNSLGQAIVYCMLVAQTFGLFLSYFSRMLKLAFLLIIAPLITLTYSIDKIGDGKAQALGNWLKEFVYTILIQPFHCVIYIAFVSMALTLLQDSRGSATSQMAAGIIAVLCIRFTKEAEKIIRKIFSFKNDENTGSIAGGMAMTAVALNSAQKIGKGTAAAAHRMAGFKDTAGEAMAMGKARAMAVGGLIADSFHRSNNPDSPEEEKKTFADRRNEAMEAINAKKAAKKLEKDNKHRNINKASKPQLEGEAAAIMAESKRNGVKMSKSLAMSQARLKLARANRDNAKRENGGKVPEIKGVRGKIGRTYKKAKSFVNQSQVIQQFVKPMVQSQMAAGIGLGVGAMMYGSGSGLAQSFGAGVAMKKGISEVMKSSTTTLASDITNRLQSIGVEEGDGVDAKLDEIVANGESNQYEDSAISDKLKEIEKALQSAGLTEGQSQEIRHSIQNSINRDVLKNPGTSVEQMLRNATAAVQSSSAYTRMSASQRAVADRALTSNGDVADTMTSYATTKQEAQIYQTMRNADEMGISPNTLADKVNDLYWYTGNDITTENTQETPQQENPEPGNGGPGNGEEPPAERDDGESQEEIEQLRQQLDEAQSEIDRLEEERDRIEAEAAEDMDEKLAEIDQRLEEYDARIDEIEKTIDQLEYEAQLSEENPPVEGEQPNLPPDQPGNGRTDQGDDDQQS